MSSSADRSRLRRCTLIVGAGLLAAGLVASLNVPLFVDSSYSCRTTWSQRTKRVWLFGLTTGDHVELSPLETRLLAQGLPVSHDWVPNWTTSYNWLGSRLVMADSFPLRPARSTVYWPAQQAIPDGELPRFAEWLRSASDSEIEQWADWVDLNWDDQSSLTGGPWIMAPATTAPPPG